MPVRTAAGSCDRSYRGGRELLGRLELADTKAPKSLSWFLAALRRTFADPRSPVIAVGSQSPFTDGGRGPVTWHNGLTRRAGRRSPRQVSSRLPHPTRGYISRVGERREWAPRRYKDALPAAAEVFKPEIARFRGDRLGRGGGRARARPGRDLLRGAVGGRTGGSTGPSRPESSKTGASRSGASRVMFVQLPPGSGPLAGI